MEARTEITQTAQTPEAQDRFTEVCRIIKRLFAF